MRCKPIAVWSACESCKPDASMHASHHAWLLAGLPVIPSKFSEHKERDVVLVLHHRHVGVMNARSCAKRMHAAFFRGESFLHGGPSLQYGICTMGTGGDLILQCPLRMRGAYRAIPVYGASLRARIAKFLGNAIRSVL